MDRQRRPGMAGRDRGGGHRSGRVVPGRAVPASRLTPAVSPTRSMSCGSATAASIRSAGGCRTRRSATVAARPIRCIGSASCCSPAANASTNAARDRMLLGLRVGDPHDELLGAWLAKESVRDVYLADTPADAATLLDKAIVGCARRRSAPRSARSARRSPRGAPRSSPTTTPAPPTDRPKASTCASRRSSAAATASDPSSTTGSACCSTPAASPGPNRPTTATHPNPLSPLRRVEPVYRRRTTEPSSDRTAGGYEALRRTSTNPPRPTNCHHQREQLERLLSRR